MVLTSTRVKESVSGGQSAVFGDVFEAVSTPLRRSRRGRGGGEGFCSALGATRTTSVRGTRAVVVIDVVVIDVVVVVF